MNSFSLLMILEKPDKVQLLLFVNLIQSRIFLNH